MPKTLKIIIVTVSILITILAIYIAPRVIPYTPPTPNTVKTDQGSFEFRFESKDKFTIESYKDYESSAKDYYSRISPFVKDPSLIVNSIFYNPGEGVAIGNYDFWIVVNEKELFKARYFRSIKNNKVKYIFYSFVYTENYYSNYLSLQELLQKPEYQNYKLN